MTLILNITLGLLLAVTFGLALAVGSYLQQVYSKGAERDCPDGYSGETDDP